MKTLLLTLLLSITFITDFNSVNVNTTKNQGIVGKVYAIAEVYRMDIYKDDDGLSFEKKFICLPEFEVDLLDQVNSKSIQMNKEFFPECDNESNGDKVHLEIKSNIALTPWGNFEDEQFPAVRITAFMRTKKIKSPSLLNEKNLEIPLSHHFGSSYIQFDWNEKVPLIQFMQTKFSFTLHIRSVPIAHTHGALVIPLIESQLLAFEKNPKLEMEKSNTQNKKVKHKIEDKVADYFVVKLRYEGMVP